LTADNYRVVLESVTKTNRPGFRALGVRHKARQKEGKLKGKNRSELPKCSVKENKQFFCIYCISDYCY
jgi:hypothetical protein